MKGTAVPFEILWNASAHEDMLALFDYLAERLSVRESFQICQELEHATHHLAEFPRLYESAPEYGDGVRRISQSGQHLLYEVDDRAQTVTVLAIVGQRQQARTLR